MCIGPHRNGLLKTRHVHMSISVLFLALTLDEKYVALESVFYPNQHIGIDEDGGLRPPPDTPARDRTSLFIPFPHSPPPVSQFCCTCVFNDPLHKQHCIPFCV